MQSSGEEKESDHDRTFNQDPSALINQIVSENNEEDRDNTGFVEECTSRHRMKTLLKMAAKKFKSFSTGVNVMVSFPELDRGKVDSRNVQAVILTTDAYENVYYTASYCKCSKDNILCNSKCHNSLSNGNK